MTGQLSVADLRHAHVQAYHHPLVAPPPTGFRGGLVVTDDPGQQRLRHSRYWQPVDSASADARYDVTLYGDYVYGGPIYAHFGHFLSEMAHRLLPSLNQGARGTWLFVGVGGDPLLNSVASAPAFFREILAFFDIAPGDVQVINQNAVVERLHISEQASDFGGGPKPGYVEALARHSEAWLKRHGVEPLSIGDVYVSRRFMPRGGTFLGEHYIEHLLAEQGVSIISPERYPLLEQMNIYRSARRVVFPEGSACHGTELLGAGALGECFLLARRQDHIEIFSRVLRPRSRAFRVFEFGITLGSLLGERGGTPWWHTGVSLFDVPKLVRFFGESDIGWLSRLDLGAYFAAARRDLDTYL
ncbi:glycosyltransferase 61 family protein, partial [Acidisphaera rubrifaciens]|uniref:glycosyltransferase 61 family protein n=1 Tax=Acidisphaera rubrifaciens TaxID=50715 RepID=UPI00130E9B5F